MTIGLCWLCGKEKPLRTSWKISDGEHDVCAECDWKIDQILKHYGGAEKPMNETWSYGEKTCLLCDRPGYPTDYYSPNFEGAEPTAIIPLCQFHKATYMSHGIKRLEAIVQGSEQESTDENKERKVNQDGC